MIGVTRRTVHRMADRGEILIAEVTAEGYRLFMREEVERARRHRQLHPPHMGRPRKHPKSAGAVIAAAESPKQAKYKSKKTNNRKRRAKK